jgi:hypothetical protein
VSRGGSYAPAQLDPAPASPAADRTAYLLVYVLVNTVVWAIWLVIALTSGGGNWWPWPIFLTLPWGIGIAMNVWDVYFRKPITTADVENEMRRLRPGVR